MSTGVRLAIYVLAFFALVTLVRDARAIAVPILSAVFLALLGSPMMSWLVRLGVRASMAAIVVVLTMFGGLALTATVLTNSLTVLSSRIPVYEQLFDQQLTTLFGSTDEALTVRGLIDRIDPQQAMSVVAGLVGDLLGVLGNMFLILVIVAFMLIEASSIPQKLRAAFGRSEERDRAIAEFQGSLVRYAGLKSLICLATGLGAGLFAWATSLDVPLLLGFLAFVLNYIPNVGSWLAAIPALLIAFVKFGPEWMVVVGLGYLAINIGVSNIIEPRVMGHGLGISPLVVFLSLLFFGWMLGPVGVILAIPLVMTMRLALASNPETRRLAYLFESASSVRDAIARREEE